MNRPDPIAAVRRTLELALELGVREWCVAAGARNASLVAALVEAEGTLGPVRNFFDERAAGFFAMGRIIESGRPVAVVTTSGTAVAELLPSVIESYYSGHPLVVISADRPVRYRGSGAPQAIEQCGIFGPYVGLELEIEDASADFTVPPPRHRTTPVHLNVCLEEPSLDQTQIRRALAAPPIDRAAKETPDVTIRVPDELLSWFQDPEELLLVAGALQPAEGRKLARLAEAHGLPVWGEAISNLGLCATQIACAEKVLAGTEIPLRRVLRFGGIPTSRYWRDLEERPDLEVRSLAGPAFPGLARPSVLHDLCIDDLLSSLASGPEKGLHTTEHPLLSEGRVESARLEELLAKFPKSEPAWVRRIAKTASDLSSVFLGNSLPIREWNLVAGRFHFPCFANRGANGIDGALSTYYGLSSESRRDSIALVGDLTALYDLTAPWIVPQLRPAKRTVIVINNGGGKIFRRLPSLRALGDEALGTIENRHEANLEPFARQWGLEWAGWKEPSEPLEQFPNGVLEVTPDPEETESFWREWSQK